MACADGASATRRNLLGAFAAAGVVGAAPAEVPAEDPHVAWFAESLALLDVMHGPAPVGLTMEEDDALCADQFAQHAELLDLIAGTPARTLAGIRAQVAVALYCAETWEGDRNEPVVAALRTAIGSLEQMSGRA